MTGIVNTGLKKDLLNLWRSRALLWVLIKRDVTARYVGSAGGLAWAYAQPLLTIASYYLVFDLVFAMRMGDKGPTESVGTFLIVGSLPWMAFCDATNRATSSLLDAAGLLQKNPLPPLLIPVKSVFASAVIFAPLLIVLPVAYGSHHHYSMALCAMLPLLLAQLAMTACLGSALAIMSAALRDTTQFVGFLLNIGIFVSPVLFPVSMFPENWRWVLWLNPMTPYVSAYQSILLKGEWPTLGVWLVLAAGLTIVALVAGTLIKRSREQLVDWL